MQNKPVRMRFSRIAHLIALFISFIAASAIQAERPRPTLQISFGDSTLVVRGARPGSTVVALGVGFANRGGATRLTRAVPTGRDEDSDGSVTLTVSELPKYSVWAAVELETGAYAVGSPQAKEPLEITIADEGWRGGVETVDLATSYLEILVVRPGVAAWTLRAADGGKNDADGKLNRILRLGIDRLRPLVGAFRGAPIVVPRDLLVAIDPQTLDLTVREAR